MHPDDGTSDPAGRPERVPGKPVLHRPEGAISDLEPDEHEVEQVKGGLKSPSPIKWE